MSVLFCHGKEGTPNGTKARMLKEHFGEQIYVPRLTNSYKPADFQRDLELIEGFLPTVNLFVGSSRGGALVCSIKTTSNQRKILIAPAWRKFKVEPILDSNDIILHSKKDDIVPFEDSVFLAERFGCTLVECGAGHRMSDPKALEVLKNIASK